MVKDKYITYQNDRPLVERVKMASEVNNIDGLELCYPKDFKNPGEFNKLITEYNLGVSAINFRSRRDGKWLRGSLSSESPGERKDVVEDLKKAMDLAVETGCYRVTTCPLNEGHDYIFEMDYNKSYDYLEETIGEAASYNSEVKICLEYKINGPRVRSILGTAGETLAFCQRLGLNNVGVTMDIGHSILAGERPAQAATLLARDNRLFYVHLNDNDRAWDWDLIPGAYNFWEFVEFLYYLDRLGYNDWIAYDVFPKEINTVENFNTVTETTIKLLEFTSRLDKTVIEKLMVERNPAKIMKYLYSLV